jgi:hypothetical protein
MSTTPALRCCVSRAPSLTGSCRYQELSSRQAISTPPPLFIINIIDSTFRVVLVEEKAKDERACGNFLLRLYSINNRRIKFLVQIRVRRVKRGPPERLSKEESRGLGRRPEICDRGLTNNKRPPRQLQKEERGNQSLNPTV